MKNKHFSWRSLCFYHMRAAGLAESTKDFDAEQILNVKPFRMPLYGGSKSCRVLYRYSFNNAVHASRINRKAIRQTRDPLPMQGINQDWIFLRAADALGNVAVAFG
nr:hypothetical protein [Mesorhizobium sp.]